LLDIGHRDLNSFGVLDRAAGLGRPVSVRQQQAHSLHIAGIAEFAEFIGEAPAVDDVAQQVAQLFPGPAASPGVAAAAFLPRSFGDGHVRSWVEKFLRRSTLRGPASYF
jgi:hypothetical protein